MAGIRVSLQVVCDFTLRSIRRKIGFSRQELLEEDWHALQRQGEESWTQAIGRGCRTAGFEAIKVPSARHAGGVNFVVFPECLQAGSSLKPLAADDLPPHPDAWSP
ncbi:RES family NAD+ phosphorylase [Blastopirellula marina]|uniref:RES domain-containing protein n=1 Tax=Blastopirellula marina TaxID=124 RepID=A0A2S8GTD6_9BACT|nr:RES family NAD+ phosphorylase [Blastopirellula marina]PQO47676.1 hypothetical protein C5Y93_03200 [Blastopirellula marina]